MSVKTIVKELKKYSLLSTVDQGHTKTTEAIISLVRLLATGDFDCSIYRDASNFSVSLVFFTGELDDDKGKNPYVALAEAFDNPGVIRVVFHTPSYTKGTEVVTRQEHRNYYMPEDLVPLANDILNHLTKPVKVFKVV